MGTLRGLSSGWEPQPLERHQGNLIDCLDVLPQHGSSSRPIVSMNHARAKLATVDEKLEERVYVFYSAERETRTPWISSEDGFEKLSDPGNVLFESIV